MTSRNILIIAIVVVLIILGVGLYFLFSGARSTSVGGAQTGQTGTLPNTGNQSNPNTGVATNNSASPAIGKNFAVAFDQPILDYYTDSSGMVTAIEPSGQIVQVTGSHVTTISSLAIQNILGASFSYDGAKLLINFGDPNAPQTSIFDIASAKWMPISQSLISPAWSPSDYRIAYRTNNANGTETISTIDASKVKPVPTALATLHMQDISVGWLSKNQIVLYTKPSAYVAGSEILLNTQTQSIDPIITEIPGLEVVWSGPAIASSEAMGIEFSAPPSQLGGSVSLIDASGDVTEQLKFSTLPSKCVFSSSTSTATSATTTTSTPYLFCGVPRDQNTFSTSHLPDDYNQMALFTSDDIYRINLQSGAVDTVYSDASQNLDISDVKFFNNMLFFVNRYNSELYSISL